MTTNTQQQDESEDLHYYSERLEDILGFLDTHKKSLDDYLSTCEDKGLLPDTAAYDAIEKIRQQMNDMAGQYRKTLAAPTASLAQYTRKIDSLVRQYRAMTQMKVPAARLLAWCSTAYDQSLETTFFQPETLGGAGARFNYDRTSCYRTQQLEKQYIEVLGFDAAKAGILLTSSGMSAYALLENFFIHDILAPDDSIYIPRQIYGETEQILFRNTKFFNVTRKETHDTAEIVADIVTQRPKLVLLETMQNGPGTKILDTIAILKGLQESGLDTPVHIMLDDSLLPGAIDPFSFASENIKIYYIVSAIKYLQLGMDSGYAGILAVAREKHDHLRRLRGFLGQNLYDNAAWLYPSLTRAQFTARMARFTRNAQLVAQYLNEDPRLAPFIKAQHPKAGALPFAGALVTLQMLQGAMATTARNLKPLYKVIDALLDQAREDGISFAHTESFGFSMPRLNVCGWCKDTPPYIRISCGDRSFAETQAFANMLVEGFVNNLHLLEQKNLVLDKPDTAEGFCRVG